MISKPSHYGYTQDMFGHYIDDELTAPIELIAGPGVAFETKDSGQRQEYPSGMRRDTRYGKPRYDLIDTDFLTRWAYLMARGAEKYGEDNWRLANSEEEYKRFRESAFRHFVQWFSGESDEDHAAAIAFNVAAAEHLKKSLNETTSGNL